MGDEKLSIQTMGDGEVLRKDTFDGFRWLSSALDAESEIMRRVRDNLTKKTRQLVESEGRNLATPDDVRRAWDHLIKDFA